MVRTIHTIELSLVENGLDFIDQGLSELLEYNRDQSHRRVKYATLHIHAGIELILKERLRQEHWSLIFAKPEDANLSKYQKGDFVSVTMEASLNRLSSICGITLEDVDRIRFNDLRKRRNKLEHFAVQDTVPAVISTITKALSALMDFVRDEFEEDDLTSDEKEMMENIQAKLIGLEAYAEQRMKDLEKPLADSGCLVITCPNCEQEAAIVQEGVKCLFCSYKQEDPEEAAEEYLSNVLNLSHYELVKDGESWPLEKCPDCDTMAFVAYGDRQFCCNCGCSYNAEDLTACSHCGSLYKEEHWDLSVCRDCFNYMVNKDD